MTDRSKGIGASDAPVIAGLSPWRSAVELWAEKRGVGTPQEVTIPMRAGNALEGLVLDAFSEETGLAIHDRQHRAVDRAWPVRWATVDGIASDNALVEAKTSSSDEGWGEPGTDEIPPHYVLQVQHALACTELLVAYVPVIFSLREFRLYQVHRDDRIIANLTDMERRFWERVQSGEAPPMVQPSDLRLVYPQDAGTSVVATANVLQTLEAVRLQTAHAKALAGDIKKWKAELQAYMAEAATLTDEDGKPLATWRTTKPVGRFDEEALRRDHPDIWKAYRRAGMTQRRFLIKGAKNDAEEEG